MLCITTEGATNATDDDLKQTFAVQFVDKDGNNVDFVAGNKHTINILFPSTLKYPQITITAPERWTENNETPADGLGGG